MALGVHWSMAGDRNERDGLHAWFRPPMSSTTGEHGSSQVWTGAQRHTLSTNSEPPLPKTRGADAQTSPKYCQLR